MGKKKENQTSTTVTIPTEEASPELDTLIKKAKESTTSDSQISINTQKKATVGTKEEIKQYDSVLIGAYYAQRLQDITESDILKKMMSKLEMNQHYIKIKQGNEEIMTLTRDGWNLIASLFGITIDILEDESKDVYEYPGKYILLQDIYKENLQDWIRGKLPDSAATKLKQIAEEISSMHRTEVRPTRKIEIKIKVRVKFTKPTDGVPEYYREEIGTDFVHPGEYRTEHFKLLTRVCNRAIRNMMGGLLDGQIIGSDEEINNENRSV